LSFWQNLSKPNNLESFPLFCYIAFMPNNLKKIFLLTGDIAILYIALYLTLLLRYGWGQAGGEWFNHLLPFSSIFFVWLIIFYIADLYNLHLAINNWKIFQRTANSLAVGILLAFSYFYLNPAISIAPKRNLFLFAAMFALAFLVWRRSFNALLKNYLPKNKIALIGGGELAKDLLKELSAKPHLGFVPVLVIAGLENGEQDTLPLGLADDKDPDIARLDDFSALPALVKKEKISTLVLAADPRQSPALRDALFACLPLKTNFVRLANFYEMITGKIPLDAINRIWFLENLSEGEKHAFNVLKRTYDLFLALVLLAATWPAWILLAALIKLESRGPAFFLSRRLGKDNREFNLYKFRTMREEKNDRSPTRNNDPRITRLGRFLRRSRLDELPQVVNILKGEMSFVGPRPERPELVKNLAEKIPFYRERLLIKPGATGWDQISGEYHSPSYEDTIKKLQYDLYYLKNRSVYLDLSIILKTIATVISNGGR